MPLTLTSAVLALIASPGIAPQEPDDSGRTHVAFQQSPAIDLYFHVRSISAGDGNARLDALAPAVEAARRLGRSLGGSPLAWGPLDGSLPGCRTAEDIAEHFSRAPEVLSLRGGEVELRKGALELARALTQAEREYQPLWEEHSALLAAARRDWEQHVGPKEQELLRFHLASLGMSDPELALPVFLVSSAPFPGALTVRGEDGRGVSFIAPGDEQDSQFFEVVLHEVTHSLDVAAGEESAFGSLRAHLREAGLGPRDRRLRDLPHALMFVQSAESIRRLVDPSHEDYGEVAGVYDRMGPDAGIVRGYWSDYLDGELTRDEALEGIVSSVALETK